MVTAIDLDRSRRVFLAALLAFVLALVPQMGALNATEALRQIPEFVDDAIAAAQGSSIPIIVRKWNGEDPTAEHEVEKLGGEITKELPIIEGFSATVPSDSVAQLDELLGARVATLDRPVYPQGSNTDASKLKSVYPKVVRATKMWSSGYTGAGVTVALIDTGITEVADLAGRVTPIYDDMLGTYSPCVNLTNESTCDDSFGHGTFMAGIIAGSGSSSAGKYKGTAPDANLVSVKIAGRSGAADTSSLLAAIQWVVNFKDRYGIRVLNLSLGTTGSGSYRTDPLNYAVQKAWSSGIVVVVSASNLGPGPQTISKPGDDPYVIAVGAIDDVGTVGFGDDRIPSFSSRGPTRADGLAKPDVVAPGAHIVSLRAPGSAIDEQFPNYIDTHYRRGSGTSMSAAVVSGAVATMLEAVPAMTPDRVKYTLRSTAKNVASNDLMAVGRGLIDSYAATFEAPTGLANIGLDWSTGMGSLDSSRGDVLVSADDPLHTVIAGTLTLQLLLWDPIAYTTGSAWYGSAWYGSAWYGSAWYGSAWYGSAWYGSAWYGSAWYEEFDGSAWYGSAWYGSAWYGAWE